MRLTCFDKKGWEVQEQQNKQGVLWLATRPTVVKRALKIAMIVGFILALINHGDALMLGEMTASRWAKLVLTFCVPYCVSTYSSVMAIREKTQLVGPQ